MRADIVNRNEQYAEVSQPVEHTMEGGLVAERAIEGGCPVAFVGEGKAFKPVGPLLIKVSLEANLAASMHVMELG